VALTSDLTNRAAPAQLPAAASGGIAGQTVEIIQALPPGGSGRSAWRVVELWSTDNVPWLASVSWSGGRAGPRTAQVLVPRATRLCVNASSVTVSGQNLGSAANKVWASIEDGYGQYQNQWSLTGATGGAGNVDSSPPAFASFVRLELANETLYATSYVEIYDAFGTLRARYRADLQPPQGIAVGDALKVRAVLSGGVGYRFLYLLGL
jgi:hypothetical protein